MNAICCKKNLLYYIFYSCKFKNYIDLHFLKTTCRRISKKICEVKIEFFVKHCSFERLTKITAVISIVRATVFYLELNWHQRCSFLYNLVKISSLILMCLLLYQLLLLRQNVRIGVLLRLDSKTKHRRNKKGEQNIMYFFLRKGQI